MRFVLVAVLFAVALAGCVGTEDGGEHGAILANESQNSTEAEFDPLAIRVSEDEMDDELNLSLCLNGADADQFLRSNIANIALTPITKYNVSIFKVLNFTRRGVNVSSRNIVAYGVRHEGKVRNYVEIAVEEFADARDYAKEEDMVRKSLAGKSYDGKVIGGLETSYKAFSSISYLGGTAWHVFIPGGKKIVYFQANRDISPDDAESLLRKYLYDVCLSRST